MVVNNALVTALLMSGFATVGADAVVVGVLALGAADAAGAVAAVPSAFGVAAGGVVVPSAGGVVVAAVADEPAALAGCSLVGAAGAGAGADSLVVLGVAGAVGVTGVRVIVSGVFLCKISGKYGLAMPRS